jgi:hypothetical protein
MFQRIQRPIAAEISGPTAFHHVQAIASHHRIQASPGFRDAADYCLKQFQEIGIDAEIISYPAEENHSFWSQIMFQEWDCQDAELMMLTPEKKRLASYMENKISIIQRSMATPAGGVEAEVILVEDAENPESYQTLNVEGKIVMASGDLEKIRSLAVEMYGAIGIITDQMAENLPVRHRMDIPDAVQYTSFWWSGKEKKCFGFVLSPKEGENLRKILKKKDHEPVMVRATVSSRFFNGNLDVVTASIPGLTTEEIMIIAHLCHPQASANDNASGCAVAIEVARTLTTLIAKGDLPQPKRTIRILLVPEFTGTYAYFASDMSRQARTMAAINLDMVGENQTLCDSSLMIESPPLSMPSFTTELLQAIMDDMGKDFSNIGGTIRFPLFRHGTMPFSGGSDHQILADPSVGVPTPMLIQWPDKFYHTSADTIDKVDAMMLKRVGILTGVYTAFLASATYSDLVWLAGEMTARYGGMLHRLLGDVLEEAVENIRGDLKKGNLEHSAADQLNRTLRFIDKKSAFILQRKEADLRALFALLSDEARSGFAEIIENFSQQLVQTTMDAQCRIRMIARNMLPEIGECCIPDDSAPPFDEWEAIAADMVPIRIHPGPIMTRGHMASWNPDEQEAYRQVMKKFKNSYTLSILAGYWMDGKRSLLDIIDLVHYETNRRPSELLVEYVRFMVKAHLIRLI